MILVIANMGIERTAPGIPHIQNQKTSEMMTRTGFRVNRLARSIGVTVSPWQEKKRCGSGFYASDFPMAIGGSHFDRVPGFASDVQTPVDIADLEHLILRNTFSPSQDPDVTRILPSG
jgi:hypothetical protein